MSEIINRIAVNTGLLRERSEEDSRDPNLQAMFELAYAWEDHTARSLAQRFAKHEPHRFVHGLELERDGVTGNLDLLEVASDRDSKVHEVKLTAKSVRRVDEDPGAIEGPDYWKYWKQAQSYAHMLDLDTAVLHICFYRGNYRDILVAYRCWEWKWTPNEMALHWRMVMNNKKAA